MLILAICNGSVRSARRISVFALLLPLAGVLLCCAAEKSQPKMEDFATVESISGGVPVYSFNNIMYVYGQSPDLCPGLKMQEGNTHPVAKIKLKKSWEIKHSYNGAESELTRRTPKNDTQPLLPIHLIDGDPDTIWCSWGSPVPDGRLEWIRIDLPVESQVSSVALVCSPKFATRDYGRILPQEVEIQVSKDAWHWETVYENKKVDAKRLMNLKAEFTPHAAKQIWIKANNFAKNGTFSDLYCFSIGEVEVRDPAGNNLALVSRGAGVTVSSTSYGCNNDRYTQDSLWNPLNYDLGNKWLRVGGDNGSYMWHFTEHEKGKLEIDSAFDASITDCVKHGVNVILNIDFKGNWLYAKEPRKTDWVQSRFREFNDYYNDSKRLPWVTDSPEMFEAYLKYVECMVEHFKDRVAYFEIGNEWNAWTADFYMSRFFEPTYAAVKKIAPGAKIMLGSPGAFLPQLLLECLGKGAKVPPGWGAKIDAVAWHPGNNPDAAYFTAVRKFQNDCRALGFRGKFFATEIYAGMSYPPGPVAPYNQFMTSEQKMAKYLCQSLVGHGGLDMEAGPCHPHFTGFPHPQSLSRWTVPNQVLNPCQPSMTYYMWRNISTVMDDLYPKEFPVHFTSQKEILSFTFTRGEKESMVAAWINGGQNDAMVETKAEVTLPGMKAKKAWIVDIMNGTEQQLNIEPQGDGTIIKGIFLKDYPAFIRLER